MTKRRLFPGLVLVLTAAMLLLAGPAPAGALRDAMALEESWSRSDRIQVQDLLMWSGDYRGRLDGDFGAGTRKAIAQFQTRNGFWANGYLDAEQIRQLESGRRDWQASMGYATRDFPELGMSMGIPAALFATEPTPGDTGLSFYPDQGLLPYLTLYSLDPLSRGEFRRVYDEAMDRREFSRDVYEVFRDDWFVFTGVSRDGTKQYAYMVNGADGVRGFVFFYDADEAPRLDRMPAIMFNSLEAYAARAAHGREMAPVEPPDRSGTPAEPDRVAEAPHDRRNDYPAKKGTSPSSTDAGAGEPSADEAPRVARADPDSPVPGPKGGGGTADAGTADTSPETGPAIAPGPEAGAEPGRERAPLDGPVIASGSGFFINALGAILTNHHVIEGCRGLRVNGDTAAETLRSDSQLDLALVQAEGGGDTPFLPFREGPARLNEDVTVIGYPLYGILDRVNVTRGSVSSLAGIEGDTRLIQITAPVQSGNSGGPVLDTLGRVVGVVQSKLDAVKLAEDMGEIAQNINFAIDARLAQEFLSGAGADFQLGPDGTALSPPDLAEQAQQATVLIECIGY